MMYTMIWFARKRNVAVVPKVVSNKDYMTVMTFYLACHSISQEACLYKSLIYIFV